MPKRMLIDATHPEETRVVVINGTRLEEFDFESSTKRQVKGNIYLAKVTRVEPSLQAAFIEYGGNRHGFLAFSEIHPDYYRIPVGDRRRSAAEPWDGNGDDDHDHDNGAGDGEEAGASLVSALPEQVRVPHGETEDDFSSDEADGEPGEGDPGEAPAAEEAVRREETFRDGDSSESRWEHPLREDRPAEIPDDDAAGRPGTEAAAQAAVPSEGGEAPPDPSSVAPSTGTASSANEPGSEAAGAVPADRDPGWEARDPATIALYAAAETIVTAEIPHSEVTETAGESGNRHDAPGEGTLFEGAPGEGDARPREPAAIALRAAEESVVAAEIPQAQAAETAGASEYHDGGAATGEVAETVAAAPGDSEAAAFAVSDGETDDDEGGEAASFESVETESVETLGGDEVEEVEEADAAERRRRHPMRHYKIQEVIKRRQIMLVQVAKEERGNKGAALTTYLSLAGRYCVLMPNTNRGGGVSRKITSLADRRRLKDILEELDIPEGMGVIVRTAGAERSKAEIKRDYEYLLRLWNEIRDLTLQSTAPALIYEEGNLIKRSIRDLYARDIDEVLVEGEEGYRTAKAFMRTLMPSHAKRVQPYRDPQVGLFHRFQVESQIDAIHSPIAQLRSGGYLVINQTEALVAIDVNSGRSTRERNIEETALRTNLEAADEIARQLRLRDLAGLIVIDFIDMEEHRNQIAVERRLKEALKNDRARIQVGRISPFGLLEMSRQRLRPSLAETSTQPCPHCGGTGLIRSVESTALHVLRSIEEEGIRRRSAEICVYVPTTVALYILNQKRDSLNQIEARYGLRVMIARDDTLIPPAFRLERLRQYGFGEAPPLRPIQAPSVSEYDDEDEDEREEAETELEATAVAGAGETAGEGEPERDHPADDERGRRRRRRRRRRGEETREARHGASEAGAEDEQEADEAGNGEHAETAPSDAAQFEAAQSDAAQPETARESDSEAERRRRRRGRRGGRLRPRRDEHRPDGTADEGTADENTARESTADAVKAGEAAMGAEVPQTEWPMEERPAVERPAVERVEIVPAPEAPVAAGAETIALDPWSPEYGLEAASLAPFAGEAVAGGPFAGEEARPEPAAETGGATEGRRDHEAPGADFSGADFSGDGASGGGVPEPETMPIAEAEQGVPFVSGSEREFETSEVNDAGGHQLPPSNEPSRTEAGSAPEPAEPAASDRDAGREPYSAAEPSAETVPSGEPAAAGHGGAAYGETVPAPAEAVTAAPAAAPEHAEPARFEAAAPQPERPEPERPEPERPEPERPELARLEAEPAEPAHAEPAHAEPGPAEPASAAASRSAEDVLVITEKPANPRRGWWQRMLRP